VAKGEDQVRPEDLRFLVGVAYEDLKSGQADVVRAVPVFVDENSPGFASIERSQRGKPAHSRLFSSISP
jgi:hypothetical protein